MIARPPTQFTNASRSSHVRSRKSFDHSPMLVFYELTRACDLVCQHCRACAQKLRDPNELGIAQSKRLIDQLSEFPDPPMLILTGDDPLKRADVYEPMFRHLTRHSSAMPQYHIGHNQRIAEINERLAEYPRLALAGSSLSGVGVPSCIESRHRAAHRIVDGLRKDIANPKNHKEDLPACS